MTTAAQPRTAVERLRQALSAMFGAERRLRGRDHARPGELTYAQGRSLAVLGREREITAGALARSADLNPASVTAMLDNLEGAGIVARRRSTTDRRVCYVSLTPAGCRLLEEKLADWQRLWEERMSDFNDDEILAAVRVLQRIGEIFDSLPPQAQD